MTPDILQWILDFGIQTVLCGAFLWVAYKLFKRYLKLLDDGKEREKELQAIVREQRDVITDQVEIIRSLSEDIPAIRRFMEKLSELLKGKMNERDGEES